MRIDTIQTPSGIYCPSCRAMTTVNGHGQCLYCDTRVLRGKYQRPALKKGPAAWHITMPVLREAYALYLSGLSLRRCAREVWPRTTYASETSCAVGLFQQFGSHGWKLRKRSDPVPESARCKGANLRPRKRGIRCRHMAQIASDYCYSHDPERATQRRAHMERVRPNRTVGAP